MLTRLLAAAAALRPRALARTAKSVDDLSSEVQQLRRSMKDAQEELSKAQARGERLAGQLHAVERSLADLAFREGQLAAIYRRDRELAGELAALPGVLDLAAITAHATRAIANARLELQPFPYAVIEQVWPEPFYEAILRGLPPGELFADRPINKRRLVVPFEWAPIYSSRVWDFLVYEVLDTLAPVIVRKFEAPLREWLGSQWPSPEAAPLDGVQYQSTDGRILLRHRGYNIPPHRDPKWGLVTCLMYLVRPGDSEGWGTQLYSVADDAEAPNVAAYWIKPESCRFEKDVPFRRNSMLMFLNSRGAHGARIPADAEPADLERYMYQFRIGPTPQSIRALMQTLPEDRRPAWAGKVVDYN